MTTDASNQTQCRFLPFDNTLLPSARPVVGKSGSDAAVALWTAAETELDKEKGLLNVKFSFNTEPDGSLARTNYLHLLSM